METQKSWTEPPQIAEIAAKFPNLSLADLKTLEQCLVPGTRRALLGLFGRAVQDADLDEILASALMTLWLRRDAYHRNRGTLSAWFFVLARNLTLSMLRARRTQPITSESLDNLPVHSTPTPEPESLPLRRLEDALAAMPETDRLLLLAYARDMEGGRWAADFATEHGISPAAVRKRRERLFERLRRDLNWPGASIFDGE